VHRLGDLVGLEGAGVRRLTMRGTIAGTMFVASASVVRKWLVAPESRIAHHLMVVSSVAIVWRRTEAASA